MKEFLIFILVQAFIVVDVNAQAKTDANDSLSLHDIVNQAVNAEVRSKPAIINVTFYVDGKQINHAYSATLHTSTLNKSKKFHKSVKIDTSKLKDNDSVYFVIEFNKTKIFTNKFNYRRFLHGGEIIAGIISDYADEKRKFIADSANYFQDNQENRLYDIIEKAGTNDSKYLYTKHKVVYNIVKSNTTSFVNFKYDFIPDSK
jgi:hypothetical protein